jgi:hypothetical protein
MASVIDASTQQAVVVNMGQIVVRRDGSMLVEVVGSPNATI